MYSYTYDKRGNKLGEVYEKKNKPEQVGVYVYDAANRMVQGTNDLGEQSVYTFNGLGQLVQNTWVVKKNAYGYHDVQPDAIVDGTAVVEADTGKKQKKEKKPVEEVLASPTLNKTSTVVKEFVIDATSPVQSPLTETEQGAGGLTYRYTYGLERVSVQIGNITTSAGNLVTDEDTVKLYYHTDRLGTYRYLTDDVSGKVTSWTDYDEWGNITHNAVLKMGQRQLDLVKNYTGHEYDSVLGEYYAKARMYSAQDKRFGQVDPISAGYNKYRYCKNNPLYYTDPLGLVASVPEASANPSTLLNKIDSSYEYFLIRQIFGPSGRVGGDVVDEFAPMYIARVAYGGKEVVIYFDLTPAKYKKETSYITGDVVRFSGQSYHNEKKLGTIQLKFNPKTNSTAVDLAALKNYFSKVWCAEATDINVGKLVTKQQMTAFMWKNVTDNLVADLNNNLEKYGITNKNSIAFFLATCAAETDLGRIVLEEGSDAYFNSHGYTKNTRGAGYLQITGAPAAQDQNNFLKYVNDKAPTADVAGYIAAKYPWESGCWEWAISKKGDKVILNDYVVQNGSNINVFLIVSYFVNGYNNAADADLRAIKQKPQKAFSYSDSNKTITINGNAYRAPNGWPEREKYYNSAMGIFA